MPTQAVQPRVRDGAARALPLGLAVMVDGVAFGVLARAAGLDAATIVVMSAIVYSGSAQYAGLSVLRAGGSPAAAAAAAFLLNLRVVPMGLSLAGELRGGPARRALEAQLVTDESWALSRGDGGRWQRRLLLGSGAVMWIAWVGGTSAGALAGGAVPARPEALGLDAAYPAAFLALLVPLLRQAGARPSAPAARSSPRRSLPPRWRRRGGQSCAGSGGRAELGVAPGRLPGRGRVRPARRRPAAPGRTAAARDAGARTRPPAGRALRGPRRHRHVRPRDSARARRPRRRAGGRGGRPAGARAAASGARRFGSGHGARAPGRLNSQSPADRSGRRIASSRSTACTPLTPFTTCVTRRSTATLASARA
jgi:predicted branched-subunit amino acid permease